MARGDRIATAGLAFGLVAPAAYCAHRLFEVGRGSGEDPLLLITQGTVGFHWRILTATWIALLAAAITHALTTAKRKPLSWVGTLPWLAPLGAAVLAFLLWYYP
ncbi:MAG: hypothetical protein KC416_17100 [Myxococcales bacterium]|nr:hypothetical protein [Myxococcales bacterium]